MLTSVLSKFRPLAVTGDQSPNRSAQKSSVVALRYGAPILSVALALAIALAMKHLGLPHPFTSLSFLAIALSFWYGGTGPGLVALIFASCAISHFVVPAVIPGGNPESYVIIYAIFGGLVSWLSASRRNAERLLRKERNSLEARVVARTSELTSANAELQHTHAELQIEKERLNLLLNLTNSIVSNLQFRDLLGVISANVRPVMQCDVVSINLQYPMTGELKLHAIDFPWAKGFLREGMLRSPESAAGRVFSTGQPFAFLIDEAELPDVEADLKLYVAEGLRSVAYLPLISHSRVLGVLGLGRTEAIPFSQDDVGFLMQIASQVAIAVENALAYGQIAELKDKLAQEKLYLEDEIRSEMNFEDIVGKSPALQRVLKLVETVAPTDSTVLILGETGTGKELIARAIHNLSRRSAGTFVKLNCAAIPAGLLESELFGHERGAFTGAVAQRVGRLELANQGTLFMDEIGEMPIELQPKLLRVLQEREFERLGSTRTIKSDVRLVVATNRNLAAMVERNAFRADLFFRLNVFPIEVPPLRERPEDIPLLVRHFAVEFSRRMNRTIETIPASTMSALSNYSWPGNIRELQNVIERAVILSSGTSLNVALTELDVNSRAQEKSEPIIFSPKRRQPVRSIVEEVDRDEMIRVLKETDGRIGGVNGAANRLGIKRTTFITRMKKLGIDPNRLSVHDGTDTDTSDTPDTLIQ